MESGNWHLSDKLRVDTTSYIVKNLVPNVPYSFQVLAAEDRDLFGIDYNRGAPTTFVIKTRQNQVDHLAKDLELDYDTVSRLASLPFHCYTEEFPYKLGQTLVSAEDLRLPRDLHPIFFGCFDWHSTVHGHWLLARAAALFPGTELARNVSIVFDAQFTAEKVGAELAYFQQEFGASFERTYGWAWLLKLQEELEASAELEGTSWASKLRPLSSHIASLLFSFLPRLVYPVRQGEHPNTAFGLALALDYARAPQTITLFELEERIVANATSFYLDDRTCPISFEPSGTDFLSPCIQEADLMARVLEDDIVFREWLLNFLPQLFDPDFDLEPGVVGDGTDGKLVHLDGLNFSRAWGLYRIASRLGGEEGERLRAMGDSHVRASIDHVMGSDYMGSHWLATFLLHALEQRIQEYISTHRTNSVF